MASLACCPDAPEACPVYHIEKGFRNLSIQVFVRQNNVCQNGISGIP
jgi:hypothetical protein